jgi:hypothetical protein
MLATLLSFIAQVPHGGVCAVLGAPRSGKSRALKEADVAGGLGSRRVVFDPYARRDLLLHRAGAKGSPWTGAYVSARELVESPEELLDFDPVRLVVAPTDLKSSALARDFSRVVRACWAAGDVSLVAEEAGLYGRQATEAVMLIASGGGHAAMRLFIVCQSLGRVPIDARRHISHLIAFAQGEPQDLIDLRSRCGAPFVTRVQQLKLGDAPQLWKLGDAMTPGAVK